MGLLLSFGLLSGEKEYRRNPPEFESVTAACLLCAAHGASEFYSFPEPSLLCEGLQTDGGTFLRKTYP